MGKAFLTMRLYNRFSLKTTLGVSNRIFGENRNMLSIGSLRKPSSIDRPKIRATHQHLTEVGGHGQSRGLIQTTFGARLPGSWAKNRPDCGSRSGIAKKRLFSKSDPRSEISWTLPRTGLRGLVCRAHNHQCLNNSGD